MTRTQTTPVQTVQRPPGGPCPGDYYGPSLAIGHDSLSHALALRQRFVDTLVSREHGGSGANTGSVEPQAGPVVGWMVYRRAFGALGGAGQGTLDPTYERTHAKQVQYSTSVQAVQALERESALIPIPGRGWEFSRLS